MQGTPQKPTFFDSGSFSANGKFVPESEAVFEAKLNVKKATEALNAVLKFNAERDRVCLGVEFNKLKKKFFS